MRPHVDPDGRRAAPVCGGNDELPISLDDRFTVISLIRRSCLDHYGFRSCRSAERTGAIVEQETLMASLTEWKVPLAAQPRAGDYGFDLDRVLASVVGLHSIIPADAFSADTLGTERAGNGVLIDDGLVLTIGYLITEAE